MADQPVPFIPSLPISPKYSPNPRGFNLPCVDSQPHLPVCSSLGSLASLHFFNALQPGAPIKLGRGGFVFANVQYVLLLQLEGY